MQNNITNKESWNKCALCGKPVHPYQESSAEPLASGIACVSCAYTRVYPTRMNNGIPSRLRCERNMQTGKWETTYEKEDKKKEESKCRRQNSKEASPI